MESEYYTTPARAENLVSLWVLRVLPALSGTVMGSKFAHLAQCGGKMCLHWYKSISMVEIMVYALLISNIFAISIFWQPFWLQSWLVYHELEVWMYLPVLDWIPWPWKPTSRHQNHLYSTNIKRDIAILRFWRPFWIQSLVLECVYEVKMQLFVSIWIPWPWKPTSRHQNDLLSTNIEWDIVILKFWRPFWLHLGYFICSMSEWIYLHLFIFLDPENLLVGTKIIFLALILGKI